MQTPIDQVMNGMGFDETGRWHEGPFADYWRWAFSDLGDEGMKAVAAGMLSKMLLGAGPGALSAEELQILYMSTPLATSASPAEGGWTYDA